MTAEELYDVLNIIYSTPHNDRPEERKDGISLLNRALLGGETAEHIIQKMKDMAAMNIDSRGKLYSAILGKFWERHFAQAIPYRKFKFEE